MSPGSGTVFGDFRVPAGSPKSTKNAPGGEKVRPETAPEAIFVVFSRRCRSESLSGPILARFFTENHAWIERVFSRKHLIFLDGATSRIVCNLHIETHFFIFSSFTFFTEKTTKNRCKTASGKKGRKTRPEDPPETRFGSQNRRKSTPGASESETLAPKTRFSEGPVFWVFFGSHFSWILVPKWGQIIVSVRHGSAKKSEKNWFGCSVGAFWCLGGSPDAFFVDFA